MIEQFETYRKQTIRNHCSIYGPNGLQTLTVPVIKVNGNHTMTRDIRITESIPWQRLHWRSIETAYNNSPFFLYYKDEFVCIYEKRFDFLVDLNITLIEVIFNILGIKKEIRFTEQFMKGSEGIDNTAILKKAFSPYTQVFSPKYGFLADLSIIDLIFNMGPEAYDFLISDKNHIFAML